MNTDRRTFLTLGVGALALAAVPAGLRRTTPLVRRRIPLMGTVAEVAIPARDEGWAHGVIDAAFAELRRVESTMSRFRPDSDVGRLNLAGQGEWIPVSEDTGAVLAHSLRWAESSDGRFDPALGRATELWDVLGRAAPPEAGALGAFAGGDLWRSLEVDMNGTAPRIRLLSDRAAVDLGGIAKGFAVDAAAEALRRHGVVDGLVNVGGDLVALGVDVTGDPWLVGVQSPVDATGLAATVEASDEAVATSGDYVRFFEHGGRRYHHLLDPDTGAPRRTRMSSLTVAAPRCVDADAGATACFGLSGPEASALAEGPATGARIIQHIDHSTEEVTP